MVIFSFLLVAALQEGPISKFADRTPTLSMTTQRKMEDVERCLIDMKGWLLPTVVRQPDRPDEVKIVWTGYNGVTAARVDLRRSGSSTAVTAWMPAKQVELCVNG